MSSWSDSPTLPVLATVAGVLGIGIDALAYLTLGFQSLDPPYRSMESYYSPTNFEAAVLLSLMFGTAACLWAAWKLFRRPDRRKQSALFSLLTIGAAAVLPMWFAATA